MTTPIDSWNPSLDGGALSALFELLPLHETAQHLTWISIGYFVLLNTGYLLLTALALFTLAKELNESELDTLPRPYCHLDIPVSILVPAFNEALTIVSSVRSLLQLSYAQYEVIVINDGSSDQTLELLQRAFVLTPLSVAQPQPLSTRSVHGVYQSSRDARLRVIDKANGGKADALNCGINFARYPLYCGVDADSVLERDSLQKVVRHFTRDPDVIAAGGTVRVANGCRFKDGQLARLGLPQNLLALFQVVEYVRGFFISRLGWSAMNAVLIVSGAFGLFRRDVVLQAGGYRVDAMGEDMELVVRLHKIMRHCRRKYRITFSAEPVCWTEAPEDMRTLRKQRIRWQRGLAESMRHNWQLMCSRDGGAAGHIAFPFMLLFELVGPVFEVLGYATVLALWLAGWVSGATYCMFLLVAVGLGVVLSLGGLLLQEMAFHIYRPRQLLVLGAVAVLENFGYRQLNALWRMAGLWGWLRQTEARWGVMLRRGSWQAVP